jgi:hypothetical protein
MARPVEKVMVWPPKGLPEMHTIPNANDLCRRGWSRQDPALKVAIKTDRARVGTQTDAPSAQTSTTLGDLRKLAAKHGIRPDAGWGINRLKAEIAAKASGVAPVVPPEVTMMEAVVAKQAAEDAEEARLMAELEAEEAAEAAKNKAEEA